MSEEVKKDWRKVRENQESEDIFADEREEMPFDKEEGEVADDADTEVGALDHPSYVKLEEKLTLAEQQAHANWEKAVRATAELENVRRRAERDIANAHNYGLEKFATALLSVVDSLEQALQLAEKEEDVQMHEGLELTHRLLLDAFKKHKIEQINPIGEAFDPQQHEAMSMLPSTDVAPNSVLTVIQKGYKLHDRVIRPARVVVSKN